MLLFENCTGNKDARCFCSEIAQGTKMHDAFVRKLYREQSCTMLLFGNCTGNKDARCFCSETAAWYSASGDWRRESANFIATSSKQHKNSTLQRIKYVFLCENQEVKEMKLRLNKQVIDRAKDYAHIYNISLSKMIEYYLECITKQKSVATEVTPLVESLSGVIHLDVIFDYTKGYSVCLAGKYKKTIKDTNIIIDRVARREPLCNEAVMRYRLKSAPATLDIIKKKQTI